jgi:hypothetical protein
MSSKKYTVTALGIMVALAIAVGSGLTALHIDSNDGVHAAQTVRHTVVSYKGIVGMSALAVLQQKYHVQIKSYSGLGVEVTGIDGVQAGTKHYWAFYVNGKVAQVGAGSYITKATDMITWKLEAL